jgi:hypothetical protein
MVAYNPKTNKKYCDLNCYYCEGWAKKECLMTNDGHHMRLLNAICIGRGMILFSNKARPTTYWAEYLVLTPEIVGEAHFPMYAMESEN